MNNKYKFFWVIEAPHPNKLGLVGYIREIDTSGTYDVYMTLDIHKAMKFPDERSAQDVITDTAFVHAMGTKKGFVVRQHGWLDDRGDDNE